MPLNGIQNGLKGTGLFLSKMRLSYIDLVTYRNDPQFSGRQIWANSADPDQTAPRGAVWSGSFADPDQTAPVHCLPFHLHRLDSLLNGRATTFKF